VSGPAQLPVNVGGPLGAWARRLVYAVRMPTAEQRRVAAVGLFSAALSAAAGTPAATPAGDAAAAAGTPLARWLKKSRA
jgi:hypothetical protein